MKSLYQSFLLVLFVALFANNALAQDPIFGQFYRASTHLNPAMSGLFNGKFRVQANNRVQWSSILPNDPFRTTGASFELRNHVTGGDYATVSLTALNDQAGQSQFTTNRGNLGVAYQKQLSGSRRSSEGQFLLAGGQVGFGQHSLEPGSLWFSKQYDGGSESVNTGLDNGENFTMTSTDVYMDFNAGILWYATFDHNYSIHAGASMQHITQPNISFLEDGDERLDRRYVIHAGAELPFNKNLSILPAAMYNIQGPSNTLLTGANIRYTSRDWNEVALRTGIWGQVSNKLESGMLLNSLIFNAILEMERWSVGISYDVNTSSVSDLSNSRGAYELSFTYVHPSKKREKIKCPKY